MEDGRVPVVHHRRMKAIGLVTMDHSKNVDAQTAVTDVEAVVQVRLRPRDITGAVHLTILALDMASSMVAALDTILHIRMDKTPTTTSIYMSRPA